MILSSVASEISRNEAMTKNNLDSRGKERIVGAFLLATAVGCYAVHKFSLIIEAAVNNRDIDGLAERCETLKYQFYGSFFIISVVTCGLIRFSQRDSDDSRIVSRVSKITPAYFKVTRAVTALFAHWFERPSIKARASSTSDVESCRLLKSTYSDAKGNIIVIEFDPATRVPKKKTVTGPGREVVWENYNVEIARFFKRTCSDAKKNITVIEFDPATRVPKKKTITSPGREVVWENYNVEIAGFFKCTCSDAKGNIIVVEFDPATRLLKKQTVTDSDGEEVWEDYNIETHCFLKLTYSDAKRNIIVEEFDPVTSLLKKQTVTTLRGKVVVYENYDQALHRFLKKTLSDGTVIIFDHEESRRRLNG